MMLHTHFPLSKCPMNTGHSYPRHTGSRPQQGTRWRSAILQGNSTPAQEETQKKKQRAVDEKSRLQAPL